MARGDIVWFEQSYVDLLEGVHNLETDTFKLGLVDSTLTPVATTADPRWGAGGSTNLSTNEVTAGGNYSANGPTVANPTVTLSSNQGVFDADDVSIAQNGSNPTNARWGIFYNDTASGKQALFALDLGSDTDLSAGAFDVAWNASGIATLGAAA